MPIDSLVSLLVTVTLVQLMVTIGLGVTIRQVVAVATNVRLVSAAAVANYFFVPACAVALLLIFRFPTLVAAGILIIVVCPGAPYGPPFTALANGDAPVSVGLMALLAASSALLSPLLLSVILPLATGDQPLAIDVLKMDETLFATQLLPLSAGVLLRAWKPELAERLVGPSKRVSLVLNLLTVGLIVAVQYRLLLEIRPMGYAGMLALALASFPGTPAVTAALAYALFQTLALALLAFAWGRFANRATTRVVPD